MSLVDVMDGLAAELPGVVYAYPPDEVTIPCSVVGYPTDVNYWLTPTSNVVLIPLWRVLGGEGIDTRDAISDAISEAGSVKAALDGAHAWGDVRVTNATVAEISIGSATYIAIRYDIEVLV